MTRKCRVCGRTNESGLFYCPKCAELKNDALKRLSTGDFRLGDELILNAGSLSRRVDEHGRVTCSSCKELLPGTAFRTYIDRTRPPICYRVVSHCLSCEAANPRNGRKADSPKQNVIQMPRDRPPSADAARQLRAVLDDIGRSLSRLESLGASHQLTQIGDEAERRTLASQLLRLANAANDLTGLLSGITSVGGHENHERSAEIRNIR